MQNISRLLTSFVFLLTVGLIAITPFRGLYMVSDFFAWVLRKILKYRQTVILQNISRSNLELTESEKKVLISGFYRNLSDIILEGMKSFSMSMTSVLRRHKVQNPEILDPYFQNNQSLILVTGHLGNWEWGSLSAGLYTDYQIIAFYSPLRNKQIDKILRWSRSRFGTILTPTKGTTQTFQDYQDQPTLFIMAADQSPARVASAHWVPFLGRPTAFLHGPEKHARNNNYPVVFAEIERVKRGYYELTLSILAEKPSELPEGEVTRRYAKKMETSIRKHPANWLWSHRRWKHKPQ
ncbi:MAG: lysophospholipid acyltransferase family protein [Bacteroidota bacterium]